MTKIRLVVFDMDGTLVNSFLDFKAIDIAKCGTPCKKFVVPSIGSIIQKLSLFLPIIFPPS